MKKLLCILTAICILAMTMGSVVMANDTDTEEINVALEQNGAVAEGYKTNKSYPVANAIDGNWDNTWQSYSANDTTKRWLKVTFADIATIKSIKFRSNSSGSASNWKIYYSLTGENDSWTEATGLASTKVGTTNNYDIAVSLNSVLAQYVKIEYQITTGTNVVIREVEVLGNFTALPYLKSLTASAGTFTSAFDMNTTSYKVQVDDFENLPTLSYEKYIADSQVAYTEASAENNYTATIAVTHMEETTNYTVQFVEYNWALAVNNAEVTADDNDQPASNAIDGNDSTMWQSWSSNAKEGRWIKVELKDYIAVNKIRFTTTTSGSLTNPNKNAKGWSVYYSLTGADAEWTRVSVSDIALTANNPYTLEASINSAAAKYVKVVYDAEITGVVVRELEVYGDKITEEYTTNCAILEGKLVGNVTYLNKTQSSVNDKYYLMAVYVDDVLYDVIPANKSANSIATGAAASTTLTSSTLPESGTVTAKLFVWDTPTTLVPVIEPLTLR